VTTPSNPVINVDSPYGPNGGRIVDFRCLFSPVGTLYIGVDSAGAQVEVNLAAVATFQMPAGTLCANYLLLADIDIGSSPVCP